MLSKRKLRCTISQWNRAHRLTPDPWSHKHPSPGRSAKLKTMVAWAPVLLNLYVDVLFYLSSIGLLVLFMTNQGPTCVSLLSSGLQEEPFRSEPMNSFVARNKSYTPAAVSTNSSSGNTSAIIDLGKVRCSMGLIQWYEGLIMFLGYATYIIFMVFNRRILGMCGPSIVDDDDNDGGGGTEKGIALSVVSPGSPAEDTSIHVESPLSKSGRALQQRGGGRRGATRKAAGSLKRAAPSADLSRPLRSQTCRPRPSCATAKASSFSRAATGRSPRCGWPRRTR